MLLILKLILIITINKICVYSIQDSDIILLPAWNPARAKVMSLTFKVFGKLVQLNMHRNGQVVSSGFKKWKNNSKSVIEKMSELKALNSCFHIYEDYFHSAIFNICQEHGLEGFVFLENDTLEIRPLQNVIKSLSFVDNFCVKEQINISFGRSHLVKRSLYFTKSDSYQLHKITSKRSYKETLIKQKRFTIELAVFVNAKAYNLLMKYEQLTGIDHITVMLKYLNRMQNLFYHPSLDVKIDILLVRLDFIKEQPPSLPIYTDNSSATLRSFCKYAANLNPPNDNDPRHWDISLYIFGEDIVEIQKSFFSNSFEIFYGLSFWNRACVLQFSCAMVTLSSIELQSYKHRFYSYERSQILSFRKGANRSSVTAVHEIGHLLGLDHDSKKKCATYVMCLGPKSYAEKLEWSTLSRDTIKSNVEQKLCLLDHTNTQNIDYDDHYWAINAFENSICENYAGREQTAKAQCESFLQDDEDANVVMSRDICKSLHCETPHKNRVYFAGRALNGTPCALGKECCDGQCVPVIEPPYIFKYCEEDNWSEWKKDSCKSNCLVKSKGTLIKRRSCQHRGRRTPNCTGLYYDVDLCDDSLLCTDTRTTIAEFTIKKCIEFMKYAKGAKMTVELLIASGQQMLHDVEKPWIACTIFCLQKKKPKWYALRENFVDSGVDRYFPDGTWCHNDDVQDYYCRQHHCLPENYSFVNSEECKNNC